jgi:hypothetical protein
VWWLTPASQLLSRQRQEDGDFKASWGKVCETLSQKQNMRAAGMAEVVEHLSTVSEALGSNPSTKNK